MPPYHATLYHTGLYAPYTLPGTPLIHPVQHGQRTRRAPLNGDEALGSAWEKPMGRRLPRASGLSFLLQLLWSDAQDPSALPAQSW